MCWARYAQPSTATRARHGLQAAREQGRVGARKRIMTDAKIRSARKLLNQGTTPREVADTLGVSVPTHGYPEPMSRLFLFHGGVPGLAVSESLLPPTITKTTSTTLQSSLEEGLTEIAQRPDKVYMTSRVNLARGYASAWINPDTGIEGGGWVYEVEVKDGTMEPDQDLLSSDGTSFQADSAVIIRIQDKGVASNPKRYAKEFRQVLNGHEAAKKAKER